MQSIHAWVEQEQGGRNSDASPHKSSWQRKTARKLAFPSCVSRTEILVRLAGIEPDLLGFFEPSFL
jgi:hypothetical protein